MYEQPYKKLVVWQAAKAFCLAVYRATENFPSHEKFGLISQLRRASVSVMTNIAEGNAKRTRPERLRYLDISNGSLAECASLLDLSNELGYLSKTDYDNLMRLHGRCGYFLLLFMAGIKTK